MNATVSAPMSCETGPHVPGDTIPLCVPEIRGNEWRYIKECLDTNMVSSVGHFVNRFESKVAEIAGTKFGVATSSGTAALHVALLVAGVQPDDEVLVPTITFIAPANAIRYVRAWPVLMDVEPRYWQMDTEKVAHFLASQGVWRQGALFNKVTHRRIKAVLPVHVLGHPVDMDPLLEVARKYNLIVIEDAAESIGAQYKGRNVGHLGDIACFSFNGNKVITTGGGGMIVTDNSKWAEKAKYLTTQAKDDPIEYIHNEVGYNYRLTNIQGALGLAQTEQLGDFIQIKRALAATYAQAFQHLTGVDGMRQAPWAFSTCWLYTILVDHCSIHSRALRSYLDRNGVLARSLWQPLHCSRAYRDCQTYSIDVANSVYEKALSLPSSVGLTAVDQGRVIRLIREQLLP